MNKKAAIRRVKRKLKIVASVFALAAISIALNTAFLQGAELDSRESVAVFLYSSLELEEGNLVYAAQDTRGRKYLVESPGYPIELGEDVISFVKIVRWGEHWRVQSIMATSHKA